VEKCSILNTTVAQKYGQILYGERYVIVTTVLSHYLSKKTVRVCNIFGHKL